MSSSPSTIVNAPPAPSPPSATAAATTDHDALPPGTRFGELEIVRVIGVGGFGIVYLARDHSLEREVALKEYMPASLAARGAGPQVTIRSSSFAETYAIGLRSFVNEARLLARFDHPSLVKVYRFWEDNGTAYMVMPYLQGVTLAEARRRMQHPPDEAWLRGVVAPILSALELLHREGVYHRDISPDNILLPRDGPPVLLDFGAARRVIHDRTQSLTAILKPSYAPIEQYAEMTELRQGPWTDLYSLGAVVHYLLFGVPPAPATARALREDDDAQGLESRAVPGVSPRFLAAMAWMLAIRPQQRPQDAEQLRAALDGDADIPLPSRSEATVVPAPAAVAARRGGARTAGLVLAVGGLAVALAAALAAWQLSPRERAVAGPVSPDGNAAPRRPVAPTSLIVESAEPDAPRRARGGGGPAPAAEAAAGDGGGTRASPPGKPPPRVGADPARAPNKDHAAAAARQAAPAGAAFPTTAREACGKRSFISMAVCMDEKCEEPRFRSGAECPDILARKRSRENR